MFWARKLICLAYRECSEEVKEAAAGIIFAAKWCSDLPELQSARKILADKFGDDFTADAKVGTAVVDPMVKVIVFISRRPLIWSCRGKVAVTCMICVAIAAGVEVVRRHDKHQPEEEGDQRDRRGEQYLGGFVQVPISNGGVVLHGQEIVVLDSWVQVQSQAMAVVAFDRMNAFGLE